MDFLKELYSKKQEPDLSIYGVNWRPILSYFCIELEKPFTEEEIKKDVDSLEKQISWADGYTGEFM